MWWAVVIPQRSVQFVVRVAQGQSFILSCFLSLISSHVQYLSNNTVIARDWYYSSHLSPECKGTIFLHPFISDSLRGTESFLRSQYFHSLSNSLHFMKKKVHYPDYNSLPLLHILSSQINPVHPFPLKPCVRFSSPPSVPHAYISSLVLLPD